MRARYGVSQTIMLMLINWSAGDFQMRIGQVCHRYFPYIGGVEEHVNNISERLAEKHDVEVLTTDPLGKLPKEEIINGVKVRRFRSWAPNEAYYFSGELKRYLMKNSESFDIVHTHNYHAFPTLYAAQAKSGNKLVFTPHYHGTGHTFLRSLLHIPYKFLGKRIFEKADKIICVSNYEKNLIINHFKVDEEKITVIPNGVNFEEFNCVERVEKDHQTILYVGRLEKYKGVHYLIKALPRLDDNIILDIIGKGSFKERLVKLAKKLDVVERVRFYQDLSRRELLQKYVNACLFVLLSKHEAYGISVAEALASRTPCIVSNTSALKEWVDNKNCYGINYPMNMEELIKIMNKVIGKTVVNVKLTSWDEAVEKLVELYKKIVIDRTIMA